MPSPESSFARNCVVEGQCWHVINTVLNAVLNTCLFWMFYLDVFSSDKTWQVRGENLTRYGLTSPIFSNMGFGQFDLRNRLYHENLRNLLFA